MKQTLFYYKVGLYVFFRLFKKEMKQPAPLPVVKKIYLWKRGFYSASYALYQLEKNNIDLYLSDWAEAFRCKFVNRNTLYIDNKILFPQLAKPFVKMIDEPFLIMDGKLIPLGKIREVTSIDELLEDIRLKGPKIFKPVDGSSGEGIIKISFENGSWVINQKNVIQEDCKNLLNSLHNYLVSEFIIQADYSNTIYSKSVNTVRIITMIDPGTGNAFIAAAAHRIGNSRSFPVDNCAAGGFTAAIDFESGKIGKATSTILNENALTWFTHHPDTNAPIEGVTIPGWINLRTAILNFAQSMSFIPYIGWDIVIIKDGFTVIEANDAPDIKLHQVHAPFLRDERIKRFYRHYKVI